MEGQPERTCVGCRQKAPKHTLLRVARRPGGGVVLDPAGTAPGRGAYVHRDPACFELATTRGGLGRMLKVSLSGGDLTTLRSEMERELNP